MGRGVLHLGRQSSCFCLGTTASIQDGLWGTVPLAFLVGGSSNVGVRMPCVPLSNPSRKRESILLLLCGGSNVLSLFDRNCSLFVLFWNQMGTEGVLKNSAVIYLFAEAFDWYVLAPNKKLRDLACFPHKSCERVFRVLSREKEGRKQTSQPRWGHLNSFLNLEETKCCLFDPGKFKRVSGFS